MRKWLNSTVKGQGDSEYWTNKSDYQLIPVKTLFGENNHIRVIYKGNLRKPARGVSVLSD